MQDPITNLFTLHTLRHNYEMLFIVQNASDFLHLKVGIAKEMGRFCEGGALLTEHKYVEYVAWFQQNTNEMTIGALAGVYRDMLKNIEPSEEETTT